jgi:hypothetical protein
MAENKTKNDPQINPLKADKVKPEYAKSQVLFQRQKNTNFGQTDFV